MAIGMFSVSGHAGFEPAGTYCSDKDPTPDGLSVTDMTFVNGSTSTYATDCYGLVEPVSTGGGAIQKPDTVAALNGLEWDSSNPIDEFDGDYSLKDDGAAVSLSYLGFKWTLSADTTTNDGAYSLDVEVDNTASPPGEYPLTTDLVFYLKAASDGGAFYLFEDVQIIQAENGGTFKIAWTKNNDSPALSGMTVFIGDGGGGDITNVPAPGTLALLALPLLGMSRLRKRSTA